MTEGIAYVFPGQGSQSPGMGADLYDAYREYREVFERADRALGYTLSDICLNGTVEELSRTRVTQPAIYTASIATLAIIESGDPVYKQACEAAHTIGKHVPTSAAGHSLGEYAACAAAGVFDFETGLRIVAKRAELMEREALDNPGKMFAVLGIATEEVEQAVVLFGGGEASVANYNCPGQVVVSVEENVAPDFLEHLKGVGAKRVIELPVSGAFHSPLMAEAREGFGEFLEDVEFAPARFPIYLSATALPASDPEEIKRMLVGQLTSSVMWEQAVRSMAGDGISTFVEIGPGQVLSKLISRIIPEAKTLSTCDIDKLTEATGVI